MDKDKYNVEGDQNDNRKSIVEQFTPHPDYKEPKASKCSNTVKCIIIAIVCFVIGLSLGIVIGYVALMFTSGNDEEVISVTSLTVEKPIKHDQKVPECKNTTVVKTVTRDVVKHIPCNKCTITNPVINGPWVEKSLFSPLSTSEMSIVYQFMLKKKLVNAVNNENKLKLKSNYVTGMVLAPPVKTEALQYLDQNSAFPGRFAVVRVVHGTHTPPYVAEYKVGPIDTSSPESMAAIQIRSISFDKRPRDQKEQTLLYYYANAEFSKLGDLIKESFDGTSLGTGSRILIYPASRELHHERESHALLALSNNFVTMDILPLTAVISHRSTNHSEWDIYDFYYGENGPYQSADDLLTAYKTNKTTKITLPKGYLQKLQRSMTRNSTKPYRQKAQVYPPHTYEPEGSRFTLDGHQVRWMGWRFEVNTHEIRGPALFDVNYKGERIVYENSINDVTLVYSSDTAGAGLTVTVISDLLLGLGRRLGFIRGIDCPKRARYLPSTYWNEGSQSGKMTDAICVFEANEEKPIWRHAYSGNFGMNNIYLVVRVAMNLINYDYMVDYHFYLDGTMKTYISATGVLFTSFLNYDSNTTSWEGSSRTPFGFRVSDTSLGSIHDHTFVVKLDLDIVDRNNSFELINWKSGTYQDVIKTTPSNAPFKYTRYLDHIAMDTEKGLVKDSKKPALWTVVNKKHFNKWGANRGYRIISTVDNEEILPHDHHAMKSLSYMKYHCAVTKQKDSEQYTSYSMYDLHGINNPIQTLEEYINGENITNTDIVTWLTLRVNHVPTSEDVPMTTMVETGFTLKPFNFFDSTDTFDMPQYTRAGNNVIKPYTTGPCYEDKLYL